MIPEHVRRLLGPALAGQVEAALRGRAYDWDGAAAREVFSGRQYLYENGIQRIPMDIGYDTGGGLAANNGQYIDLRAGDDGGFAWCRNGQAYPVDLTSATTIFIEVVKNEGLPYPGTNKTLYVANNFTAATRGDNVLAQIAIPNGFIGLMQFNIAGVSGTGWIGVRMIGAWHAYVPVLGIRNIYFE